MRVVFHIIQLPLTDFLTCLNMYRQNDNILCPIPALKSLVNQVGMIGLIKQVSQEVAMAFSKYPACKTKYQID